MVRITSIKILIYIFLTFYVVLDMQMYPLCRNITVYYFMGTDVQNSIVIVCVRVSSYIGTVHWTQVEFIPAHPTYCCFSMERMVTRTRHNIRHIVYLVYYIHSCTRKELVLCMLIGNVNFTPEQATKTLRGSIGIALLFP